MYKQTNTICKPKRIRLFAFIISCTILMKIYRYIHSITFERYEIPKNIYLYRSIPPQKTSNRNLTKSGLHITSTEIVKSIRNIAWGTAVTLLCRFHSLFARSSHTMDLLFITTRSLVIRSFQFATHFATIQWLWHVQNWITSLMPDWQIR